MAQRVNIEGLGVVNFPDDYTPDKIKFAIENDILPRVNKDPSFMERLGATGKELGRQAGLTARHVIEGAGSIAAPINAALGLKPVGAALTSLGFPEPQGEAERLVGGVSRGMVGAMTGVGAGGALAGAAGPVASGVGRVLSSVPGMQLASGAGGGLAGGVAEEAGAGPVGQLLASLAGGVAAPYAVGARGAANVSPSVLTPQQIALRQEAEALGYTLTPAQMTGKTWQRNLEAAMAQAPSTSGRMQAINAKNAQLTNRLTDEALAAAGGEVDQGTAGSAALRAMTEGAEREAGKTGAAYRDLLAPVDVSLEGARPALEQLRKEQLRLPADQQGGAGMTALENLLGSPGYVKAQRKGFVKPSVEPQQDDLITAVRKLGGIAPSDEAVGSLAKSYPFPPDPRLGPVWAQPKYGTSASNKTTGGHSLDYMAQRMHELGYIDEADPSLLMDKLSESATGTAQHFSMFKQHGGTDPLADAIKGLTAKMAEKQQPKQEAGYLREHPEIPGNVAQDIRSGYGAASQSAFESGKVQQGEVYVKMKAAVDRAIEQALPKEAKSQFANLNEKYGLDMALAQMKPTSQEAFLTQLYRGAPDQFYTFLGVADPQSFSKVSRAFLTHLVERATNQETGNVEAAKLGRFIDKLAPDVSRGADVMKYLGGESGQRLKKVGDIGQNVLPEAVKDSGTGQRLMYQGLLRGGGLFGGGAIGGGVGGVPGAVIGAALGEFAIPKAIQGVYLSELARPFLTRRSPFGPQLTPEEILMRRFGGLVGGSLTGQ